MTRFFSVHWNARAADGTSKAKAIVQRLLERLPTWRVVFCGRGFCVASPVQGTGVEQVRLDQNAGLILGTLFPNASGPSSCAMSRILTLDARQSQEIVQSRGRALVSSCWGNYVVFLADPDRPSSHVLRGPLASIKCFHATHGPASLFFSHVEDLDTLGLFPLTVNWDTVRAQAASADFIGRDTALKQVTAVEGGECLETLGSDVTRAFYWHPCDFAERTDIRDFDTAVFAVRSATHACVQSWAARYGRIVHTLSGGLDSSISLSCARNALSRADIVCINYFTDNVTGDERNYARDVACSLDVELVEMRREAGVDLDIFRSCAKTAWPMLDFSGYGQHRKEVAFGNQRGAAAIFSGEFGDNIFEQGAGLDGAGDYVRRFGIRPGLLRVAMECGLRRNRSVWQVLRRAIVDGSSKRDVSYFTSHSYIERELRTPIAESTLLRNEALDSVRHQATRFMHPWMDRIGRVPPAKFMMIYGLYAMSAHEPPFALDGDPPFVAPLGSQPLVETCLRVPSCFCIHDGFDRAVARNAFADSLPTSVIWRTTKGTPEPWTRDVIRRNQAFLKDFLLDGILVSTGILDAKRVEGALSNDVTGSRVFVGDIIEQLYIEAWLRQWTRQRPNVAA